jgi:large subunit ribosomal protein L18|tara:strand:- start:856 stop:1209 length:354 start_codon:yes stop_codon:yes gene_type:complete
MNTKTKKRNKIKKRIRKVVFGTSERPRMTVFRSNKAIYVQIINDKEEKTLVSASSTDKDLKLNSNNKSEIAKQVGVLIGNKAIKAGIKSVSFDRNGYLYHGRVKSLADGAREAGLNL